MSGIGNILKQTTNFLTPAGQTERITFRRFDGYALAEASENNSELKEGDVTSIVLKVNPEEISYVKPKITQKVQTAAPKRFVVFEWGTDLTVINISGNTGNMLPAVITSGFDPLADLADSVGDKVGAYAGDKVAGAISGTGDLVAIAQRAMLGTMSYFELLELSPKYRIFRDLQDMYETFDADTDILTMEMGDFVYRGYFQNFTFTQTAMNPWNWKYNIEFIVLDNLTQKFKEESGEINDSSSIAKGQ